MKNLIIILLAFALGFAEAKADQTNTNKKEQYIVVLKHQQVQAQMFRQGIGAQRGIVVAGMVQKLAKAFNTEVKTTYSKVLEGGVLKLTSAQAKLLEKNPNIAYVEKDQTITIQSVQNRAPWGLDRLDQVNLPLDSTYDYPDVSTDVHAYVIDTGVRITHNDFGGRAFHGYDFVDNDADATDCNGHGTHVAGTIGGTRYGVSKSVKIYGIRVLSCTGSGQYSDVLNGIEWVAKNHKKPAVANMSLGGPVSQAVDDAVVAAVNAGVTMVVAAGNSREPACRSTPSRVPEAITVGSSDSRDNRSGFSNYGTCVDVFAPGSNIQSTWHNSDSATNTISGTSMAAPHVAGVAALYLAGNPTATPTQVNDAIVGGSLVDKLRGTKSGSPNLLANTNFIENPNSPPPPPAPPAEPVDPELTNGKSVLRLAGDRGEQQKFFIDVPEGATNLVIATSGGQGDADLYVRFDQEPTKRNYDCRPYDWGNNESCEIAAPNAGIYHVMISASRDYENVELRASFDEPGQLTANELEQSSKLYW